MGTAGPAARAASGLAVALACAPLLTVPAAARAVIDCAAYGPAATPVAAVAAAFPDARFPAGGGRLTVFAAASLTDAFERMATDLEAAHPGLDIVLNFAGSQALASQLAAGARADVFASADLAQILSAAGAGAIEGRPVSFASNRLAIVAPAANPAGLDEPADLAADGLKLVLAQPAVPAGRYARQALCAMGAEPAFGPAFVERAGANLVSEEEDVRDVLAKVELGEADAGIVYGSDAVAAGDAVIAIPLPDGAAPEVTYPVAAVRGGDPELAAAFIAYLLSDAGQATLAEFGFAPAARAGA